MNLTDRVRVFAPVATAALKRRKVAEQELDRLQGTKFQLETQVTTLESASFNAETMAAMKKAAGALKDIHRGLYVFHPVYTHFRCVELIVFSLKVD